MRERREGVVAAARRFPSDQLLIERLVLQSDDFRDLCDDLAACDAALARAGAMSGSPGEERRSECREWIEDLTADIGRALEAEKHRIRQATGSSSGRAD